MVGCGNYARVRVGARAPLHSLDFAWSLAPSDRRESMGNRERALPSTFSCGRVQWTVSGEFSATVTWWEGLNFELNLTFRGGDKLFRCTNVKPRTDWFLILLYTPCKALFLYFCCNNCKSYLTLLENQMSSRQSSFDLHIQSCTAVQKGQERPSLAFQNTTMIQYPVIRLRKHPLFWNCQWGASTTFAQSAKVHFSHIINCQNQMTVSSFRPLSRRLEKPSSYCFRISDQQSAQCLWSLNTMMNFSQSCAKVGEPLASLAIPKQADVIRNLRLFCKHLGSVRTGEGGETICTNITACC